MKLARQLSLSYVSVFIALVGVIIFFVGAFVYGELLRSQTANTETLVSNMRNMLEVDLDNTIQNYLRGIAEKNVQIAGYFYQEYASGRLSEAKAKDAAANVLLSQKIGKTGYVYCVDSSGTIRVHPNAALKDVDLSKYDFIVAQTKERRGYIEYDWANPGETEERPKSLSMAYFEPWDWIVSVSAYRTEFLDLIDIGSFEKGFLEVRIGESGYMYIIDGAGKLLVHPKMKGENIAESKDAKGNAYIKEMLEKKEGEIRYDWLNPGESRARAKIVYYRHIRELDWIVAGGTYIDELTRSSARVVTYLLLFLAGGILVFAFVNALVVRMVTRPIGRVILALKDISEGEGDLTRKLEVVAKNEILDLVRHYNRTIETLGGMVSSIKGEAETLESVGGDLSANMAETASAVERIIVEIADVRSRSLGQAAGVAETQATLIEISKSVQTLNAHIVRQAESVAESSASIEEMVGNIASVGKVLQANAGLVAELSGASELGKGGMDEVSVLVQAIAHESEGLLETSAIIQGIASRTNLLAMNAAIEAAHAGQSGRGFAVVADEIRKLAENAGRQGKAISDVLKKLKLSIDRVARSSNSAHTQFEIVFELTKKLSDHELAIKGAMEEQDIGGAHVLESIAAIKETTFQVKGRAAEMLEGNREVLDEMGRLSAATQGITRSMNEISERTGLIRGAVGRVNEMSDENKRSIDRLHEEVSRFKVG